MLSTYAALHHLPYTVVVLDVRGTAAPSTEWNRAAAPLLERRCARAIALNPLSGPFILMVGQTPTNEKRLHILPLLDSVLLRFVTEAPC